MRRTDTRSLESRTPAPPQFSIRFQVGQTALCLALCSQPLAQHADPLSPDARCVRPSVLRMRTHSPPALRSGILASVPLIVGLSVSEESPVAAPSSFFFF